LDPSCGLRAGWSHQRWSHPPRRKGKGKVIAYVHVFVPFVVVTEWDPHPHTWDVCAYTRLGEWAFPVAGPWLWNGLPSNLQQSDLTLQQFRPALKTYLFGWVSECPAPSDILFVVCYTNVFTYLPTCEQSVLTELFATGADIWVSRYNAPAVHRLARLRSAALGCCFPRLHVSCSKETAAASAGDEQSEVRWWQLGWWWWTTNCRSLQRWHRPHRLLSTSAHFCFLK